MVEIHRFVTFAPILAEIATFFAEPGSHGCWLGGRTQAHRTVDRHFGGFQVTSELNVRDFLRISEIVKPV